MLLVVFTYWCRFKLNGLYELQEYQKLWLLFALSINIHRVGGVDETKHHVTFLSLRIKWMCIPDKYNSAVCIVFRQINWHLYISPNELYNLHVALRGLYVRVLSTTSNPQTVLLLSTTGKWVTSTCPTRKAN